MTSCALEAHGLSKSYGAVRAVDSFDVTVPRGTVVGFLGPNGAGKTTVVRMLSAILQPDAGSFSIGGVPGTRPDEVRRRIGVLPESTGRPRAETGAESLAFHARLHGQGRAEARATATRLLGEVGLSDRADTLVPSYSRGMRQRLGVARALVNDPEVVLLDEPTLGVDPHGRRQLLDLVTAVARGRGATVVMSTHELDEVEQTCDRVVIMNRGRVVAEGTVADVVRRAAAPRRAMIRLVGSDRGRAAELLGKAGLAVDGDGGRGTGELALTLPAGVPLEVASTRVLGVLLDGGVPVLGLTVEGGRLSDAFLAVTEAGP